MPLLGIRGEGLQPSTFPTSGRLADQGAWLAGTWLQHLKMDALCLTYLLVCLYEP